MPRRKKENVNIKVRVRLTRRMRKQEAIKLVHQAIKRRIVPEGIELQWLDWSRAEGGAGNEGSYLDDEAHDALVNFYHMLTDGQTRMRIAVVDAEGEEREVLEES